MRIRDYYDRVATEHTPNYQKSDRLMDALVHRPNERFVRRLIRLKLQHVESIADLGCGTGEHLLGSVPKLKRLFLNDLSPNMLDETTARLSRVYPDAEIESHCSSIEEIPANTRTSDTVLCLGVLNHFKNPQLTEVLATLARLAQRTILIYYAHEGFLLANRVGVTFREMDIHYRAIKRSSVVETMGTLNFDLARSSYAFKFPMLSPLVVQEYRKVG